MVVVGVIKSLMSSVFTIQFTREESQTDHRLCNLKVGLNTTISCLHLIKIQQYSRNAFTINRDYSDTKHGTGYNQNTPDSAEKERVGVIIVIVDMQWSSGGVLVSLATLGQT